MKMLHVKEGATTIVGRFYVDKSNVFEWAEYLWNVSEKGSEKISIGLFSK